ncbi:MAG: hypothetical protein COC14_00720 [Burkholderiaceae bacterium]|nr:hypothetical protein C3Z06_21855 [Cupriavidus metallidurans]PCH58747.1 MAG: hypothetical protein COC14_00720 [Burkholderiaceae bacterium]
MMALPNAQYECTCIKCMVLGENDILRHIWPRSIVLAPVSPCSPRVSAVSQTTQIAMQIADINPMHDRGRSAAIERGARAIHHT